MTARKQTKQADKPALTRDQILAALDKMKAADEASAKERRRPMTPSDLGRISELTEKRRLNADERRELATLQERFDADRLRRDLGGTVHHTPDGDKYAAGERRATRTLKAQRWVVDRLRPDATAKRRAKAGRVKAVIEQGKHKPKSTNAQGQTVDVCKDRYIELRKGKTYKTHNAAATKYAQEYGFTVAQVKRAAERGKWFDG